MTATSVLFSRLPDLHVRKPPKLVHEFDFDSPPTHISKDSMPLLSLARFGDKPTPDKGCYRHDDNVVALIGVVGDYDGSTPPISIEEAERRLTAAGIATVLYTTPSWTEENPRWRVLSWFSREMTGTPEELAALYREHLSRVQGALGADCPLKTESWSMSQSFYFGRVRGVPYKCLRSVGAPVDLVSGGPRIGNCSTGHAGGDGRPVMPVEKAIEVLRSGEDTHNGAKDLSWHRANMGWNRERIREEIIALAEESPRGAARLKALEAGELDRLIEGAFKKTGAAPPEEEFEREDDTGWEPPTRADDAVDDDEEPLGRLVSFTQAAPTIPTPVIEHWLPRRVVTLLGAHGGVGKSFTAMEVAVRVALGMPVFHCTSDPGTVMFFSCEDEEAILRWRADRLAQHFGHRPEELEGRLVAYDMTREKQPELFIERQYGEVGLTVTFRRLRREALRVRPALLVVDNASDVYAANENNRAQVRQFMRLLKGLAQELDCAILLLAHTNKQTAQAKAGEEVQGYSGSTAWHNSARSRWFMAREEGDRQQIVLCLEKANYGRSGQTIEVRWHEDKQLLLSGDSSVQQPISDLVPVILAKLVEWDAAGVELRASARSDGGGAQGALRRDVPELKRCRATALQIELEKLVRDGYLTRGCRKGKGKSGRDVELFVPTDKARAAVKAAARVAVEGPREQEVDWG